MNTPEEYHYPRQTYRRRKKWLWLLLPILLAAGGFLFWQNFRVPLSSDESERVSEARRALDTKPLELWGKSRGKTILLIGADRREGLPERWGRSDTIIVARLLPSEKIISLLSIPRDLQVDIPGYGFNKINAAYSYGGPRLLIATVRDWIGAPINHFIEIDFDGFSRMVEEVGGVYLPIDQRYYHSNEGLSPEDMYSEIDIEAGYQKLQGEDALAFVRHRRSDTDFLRASRQQIFLRELSRQLQERAGSAASLPSLAEAFLDATTSDIRSPKTLLELGNIARSIGSDRIIRVTPEASELISSGVFYLVASPQQREEALRVWNNPELLLEPPNKIRYTRLGEIALRSSSWLVRSSRARPFAVRKIDRSAPLAAISEALSNWRPLFYGTSAAFASLREELNFARKSKRARGIISRDRISLPGSPDLQASPAPEPPQSPLRPCRPQSLPPGYSWPENYKEYYLEGRPALSLWAQMERAGGLLWTWTSWQEAPALQKPDQIIKRGGRKLFLFWDSGRLRLVAWRSGRGYGWLTNTLNSSFDAREMITLAMDCKR